jgi:hypothetical protein
VTSSSTRDRLGESLAAFTQQSSLSAEHRRLMTEHHHAVAWERSTAAAVPEPLRSKLAELWRGRMISEHRSVGIFALYTLDLLGAGAPADVLSIACRAALDEVRHTELFARLAALYSGREETPPPGIPPMPEDPTVSMRSQVAREALFLSVCAETYSAVLLGELHARASDPVVRDVLGVVIADEVFHARMGWAFLASLLKEPAADEPPLGDFLQAEIVPMFDEFAQGTFGDPAEIPEPSLAGPERELAEAHGYISRRDEYALFRAAIAGVWVPGLAALGLDGRVLLGRFPAPAGHPEGAPAVPSPS